MSLAVVQDEVYEAATRFRDGKPFPALLTLLVSLGTDSLGPALYLQAMSPEFVLALLFLARATQRVLEIKEEMDEALEPPRRGPMTEAQRQSFEQRMEAQRKRDEELRQANLQRPPQPVESPTRWVETPYGREPLFGDESPDDPQVLQRIEAANRASIHRCQEYYAAVERKKWGSIPPEMRAGLRVDRWGTVWEKNPRGRGWRELGSDDDYETLPNSSW